MRRCEMDFLPRDASAERVYEIACRPSVRLYVRLPWRLGAVITWLEFYESSFTAK